MCMGQPSRIIIRSELTGCFGGTLILDLGNSDHVLVINQGQGRSNLNHQAIQKYLVTYHYIQLPGGHQSPGEYNVSISTLQQGPSDYTALGSDTKIHLQNQKRFQESFMVGNGLEDVSSEPSRGRWWTGPESSGFQVRQAGKILYWPLHS